MKACYSVVNIITSGIWIHLGHTKHWTELGKYWSKSMLFYLNISDNCCVQLLLSPDQTKPRTKTLPIAEWFIWPLCNQKNTGTISVLIVMLLEEPGPPVQAPSATLLILLCTWMHLQIQHQWLDGSHNSFSFRQSMDKLFGKAPTVKGEIQLYLSLLASFFNRPGVAGAVLQTPSSLR